MAALSVVLIVKDEADNLENCLASVDFADEIVVLDSGSRDATVSIARAHTDKVSVNSDWQGFGIQRQRAQALANGDWILMLDADERVSPALAAAIRRVVEADEQNTVYELPRLSWCFGRFIRHGGWYPDYVTRLYPRKLAQYDSAPVHEKLDVPTTGVRKRLQGDLIHYTYRDLHHYLVKSAGYARDWAGHRQARGKRGGIAQGVGHGLGCFLRMYLVRLGFLDGRAGLLLALLSAHSTFVKYADLWLRGQPDP